MIPASSAAHIIILADVALPRMAWEALLAQQPGLTVWGTVANLDDVHALPATGSQTAVLLDLMEPLVQQVAQLTKAVPNYGLLCLVNDYDLSQIVTLLQAGASGVLSRDETVPELVQALVAAGRGEIVLPPSLAARALAALVRGEMYLQRQVGALTEREREVLDLLAQGLTNKDIAQSLFLSVRTIEAHLRHIYGKLDVTSRTEAVLWAVQHGFEP
ncbi:MAG: response regulator transcription factor [Anaerolineales bacterium]|nr:response regulator transcription factor [Anaerolineales bacterium]